MIFCNKSKCHSNNHFNFELEHYFLNQNLSSIFHVRKLHENTETEIQAMKIQTRMKTVGNSLTVRRRPSKLRLLFFASGKSFSM